MTTADLAASGIQARPRSSSRIGAIVRLHLVNKQTIIGIPFGILAFVLLVNIAIWWIISTSVTDPADLADAQSGLQWSGAAFYPFVYAMVIGIVAISSTFPLALGFSVTRRDFYLGTALTYLLLSALFGAIFTVLGVIETATDGWGFKGRMFTAVYFGSGAWYERFLLVTAAFLFFFFIGTMFGTIYARWRAFGTLVFFALFTLILVVLALLATLSGSWPAVGDWLVRNGPSGLVAWSLLPTALAAVAGYLVLRKATARN